MLRKARRPGVPLDRLSRGEPLRPALAIEALSAAAAAHFGVGSTALFAPALADWRDAVGCADPLLVPQGALPLPLPSWCAWLIDADVLRLDGGPSISGPRVVQHAWLLAVREAELQAVEAFPVIFAGGFAASAFEVHLAISPGFLGESWRGPVCVRAAVHRAAGPPVQIWLGAPSSPGKPADGASGETVATWAVQPGQAGISGWPRWAVLRALEGREPQALWDLRALWGEREQVAPPAGAPVSLRLGVDVGSTATMVVEEESASAGAVGGKLFGANHPSGFRRLAGAPETAGKVGCAEQLIAPSGQLPTALCAGSPAALQAVLAGAAGPEQLWLPQGGEALRADRFKSPDLLVLSDWLAQLPEVDPVQVSKQLLEIYGLLLGRTLAAAHGAPLVTPDGGRWTLRAPRLSAAEAVLTYPECAFGTLSDEPFSAVLDGVGRELCRGLRAAWPAATHRLVADPAAARAARGPAPDVLHPIEVLADFGGLTLQIAVRLPQEPGRPAPLLAGTSMSYLLGGERLIDSGAYASAEQQRGAALRVAFRGIAREWRAIIGSGARLEDAGTAAAVRSALLEVVFALVQRQLEGTLRRAQPHGLRGAGVRLDLLGEGWKLLALDTPDEAREAETQRILLDWIARKPLLPGVPVSLQRMSKRRLCEGALRVQSAPGALPAVELQGVDLEGGAQRWFGVAGAQSGALDPADPWWASLTGLGRGSLLRVEQWFNSGGAPLRERLRAGPLAFDPRRSLLKQWLDVSGPSLVALRIHERLK